MSDINETIAEVLRLDAEATPGPWSDRYTPEGGDVEVLTDLPVKWAANLPEGYAPGRWDARTICDLLARRGAMRPGLPHGQRVADAALIAYYRTAAPALAREVKRLQAEVERLQAEVERLQAEVERLQDGHRAGQEAMRERCMGVCSELILRARVCAGDDEGLRDLRCLESHMLRAIRTLEVSHD